MKRYHSKPGKHGTLYLYRIEYTCSCDPDGFGVQTTKRWAYSSEHAQIRFEEEESLDDTGFKFLDCKRLEDRS